MLKATYLMLLTLCMSQVTYATEEHATISLQRFKNFVVVSINHDSGWHTYWKNPGDAGLPSTFKFSQDSKPLEVKAQEWPTPTRYMESGDILTIGYSGIKHFFFDDPKVAIDLHVTMLICKDICIPGEAKLKLGASQAFASNRLAKEFDAASLEEAYQALPVSKELPPGFAYYLTRVKGQNLLTLHYTLKGVKNKQLPHELGFLTAFPKVPFGFKREKLYLDGDTLYGKTEIDWDGEYQDPVIPLPEAGQFAKPFEIEFLYNSPLESKVQKIKLELKDFTNSSPTLDNFYQKLPPFDGKGSSLSSAPTTSKMEGGFLQYMLLAFLGGLILNLMPCVLPVISLKLFGLIKHRNTPKKRLMAHNLSYTAGVISTFLALAVVVAALKATGEEIGWGFQLQSPAFIMVMILILFILSMNLFGLFEFYTPGGSKLGGTQVEEGLSGDFFSGVLTTILATPCSAPFLGTALTFAFTTSNATIFLMFFMIGLGLAFPFLLTALFPKSLYFFPRPGAWMEKLKYFLGLSLIATAIWLYDVFVSLVHFEVISWRLNLLLALWFFAFFFAQKISQRKILQFVVFALPLSMTVMAMQNLDLKPSNASILQTKTLWIPWTEDKMIQESTKPVFVDFTAEWCLTCTVNKKLVLETDGFEELRAKYEFITMRADWTKRDDNITQFLRRHGAVGVPAYFIQRPGGKLISLGETISLAEIEENLQ